MITVNILTEDKINKKYEEIKSADDTKYHKFALSFNHHFVESGTIGSALCEFSDLDDLIHELQMMKQTVEKVTGLNIERG